MTVRVPQGGQHLGEASHDLNGMLNIESYHIPLDMGADRYSVVFQPSLQAGEMSCTHKGL